MNLNANSSTHYQPRQDFKTCEGCGFPSGCKVAHACNIKRQEREARMLEAAARELCRMRGDDPDAMHPDEEMLLSPRWKCAAAEIIAHEQRAEAIAHGRRTAS